MLFKTSGIVFKFIKYRETSIITNIFTSRFGLQSYIVNGIRSKKSRQRMSLFQPMTILDLVVYHKETSSINRISEVKCKYAYEFIPRNMKKSYITMFLTEFLYKTIRQESNADKLFEFMEDSMITFDKMDENYENFHLHFLIKLTRYIGLLPADARELHDHLPENEKEMDFDVTGIINTLINSEYGVKITMGNEARRKVLNKILLFYRMEFDSLKELNSIKILKEVME